VYRGRMVDMRISNDKLQARAERMVMELAGGTAEEAHEALKLAQGNTKRAVLVRRGVALADIEPLLERCQGNLHLALAGL
ncbi:MAG: N-acetylmuramic acid 6-phosphate etherase, partial [Gluconobacter sp.]